MTPFQRALMATDRDVVPCVSGRYDPDLWFSNRSHIAKRLCSVCPLVESCREEGMQSLNGVFGGWSGRDRSKHRNADMQKLDRVMLNRSAELDELAKEMKCETRVSTSTRTARRRRGTLFSPSS